MNELIQTFNFGVNEVRTAIKDNGDVYFCLKDIATVLGIQDTQTKNFNLDEKGVEKIPTPTKGGIQNITFVNEPNLYRVIFRSNKAEARQFQDWVFNEVLPTIRKTGSYNTKPTELTAKEKVECLSILMSTFGDVLSKEAKETILVTASENLLGLDLGYRPQVQKTYTATQIGEQSVHEYFKDRRVRGEWFKVDESEVIRFLECSNYTLKIQTLDVSGNEIFNKIK